MKRRRPKTDWNCREILDAHSVSPDGESHCEFCGTRIRWIHVLEHDDYHRAVEAGCCCALKYCCDYDAEAAERQMKNQMARLRTFVNPDRWSRSRNNPENIWRWVKLPGGERVRVTVFLKNGRYGIYIASKSNSDDRFQTWDRFATQQEAMAIAFELIEQAKAFEDDEE